jgi:hypothetical protein
MFCISAWVLKRPLVITMYALAVPSICAFLYVEAKHAENPIVPPYLWKNRNVVTLLSINIFMGMTFWSLIFYLPIYFQVHQLDFSIYLTTFEKIIG